MEIQPGRKIPQRVVSASEVMKHLPVVDVPPLMVDNDYYSYKYISIHKAMEEVSTPGDFAQFGVYKGRLANYLLNYVRGDRKLHLFDSFEGLPSDWVGAWKAGTFALSDKEIPTFNHKSVKIHKGWFSDTVPQFCAAQNSALSFIHVDCDLYSSTRDVLYGVNKLIVPSTVLLFDEYMMTSQGATDDGEHRALLEWKLDAGREVQYLWRTRWMQVCVRVLA